LTICMWCGDDVREPEPDLDMTDVRVRGPLTVIEGKANRRGADQNGSAARAGAGSGSPLRGSTAYDAVSPSVANGGLAAGETASELPTVAASASSQAAVAGAGPGGDSVRQLRNRLGPTSVASSSSGAAANWATAPATAPRDLHDVVLATAIFMTGNRGLQAGSRYGIAIVEDELRILGPVDVDPAAIAITHQLRAVDASGFQERLIITGDRGRRRERLALVFMSVAGGSAERVADAIVSTVAAAQLDRR
jgi:hypothetical protein